MTEYEELLDEQEEDKIKYNEMFIEQGGECAICGKHQGSMVKALIVHDDEESEIRLLCADCIRLVNYDLDTLTKTVDYLKVKKDK